MNSALGRDRPRSRWLGVFLLILLSQVGLAAGKKRPSDPPHQPPAPDRNWVAIHLFDSIYPMTEQQTFAESLASLEVMNQLFTRRQVLRDLFKTEKTQGTRSREGHYMVWLHLSDSLLAKASVERTSVPEVAWVFKDRQSDIFTGWSGDTNLVAFLKYGVRGLGMPVVFPDGTRTGNFQGFEDAVRQGEADYEGGFYLTDEQALRAVEAFRTYEGPAKGYTFLRDIRERPNAPFEPPAAQLVNGYNCGDFAYHVLTSSGVVSRAEVEALKVQFWYPREYFDQPLPVRQVGAKGMRWLAENPDAVVFPGNVMTKLGWSALLFDPSGLEFFDKKALVENTRVNWTPLSMGRIWEHAHAIEWLKRRGDFHSKGIITELKALVDSGLKIQSPERSVEESPENRYRLSKAWRALQRRGDRHYGVKMREAELDGEAGEDFHRLWDHLKSHFWGDSPGGRR